MTNLAAGDLLAERAVVTLTWNVQSASSERSERQAAWLAKGPAHVVALTEVGPHQADTLCQALEKAGFTPYRPAEHGPGKGVVLAVRDVAAMPRHDVTVSHLPQRFLVATIGAGSGSALFSVLALYVPSRGPASRRNMDKRAFQSAVQGGLSAALAATADHGPMLVLGDLNVVEPDHVPHLPVFGSWEYEFYRSFDQAGLEDAYRRRNPAGADHSWFGRSGTGYRLDHAFYPKQRGHEVAACYYDHYPRLSGLSDHSALVVHIDQHSDRVDPRCGDGRD